MITVTSLKLLVAVLMLEHTMTLVSSECRPEQKKPATTCRQHDADVLIIGAGMAGISAGYTLSKSDNGTTSFLIFEAEDCIGGRVKRKLLEHSGVYVELGANWIQGIDPLQPDKHPLWSASQKCGGLQGFFMQPEFNTSFHIYNSSGEEITNSSILQQRIKYWYSVEDKLGSESLERLKLGLPDVSVRSALKSNGWIPESPLDSVVEWVSIDYQLATPPDNASLLINYPDSTYRDFGDPSRTLDFYVADQKIGFAGIVECLANQYLTKEDPRLHLHAVVNDIEWSDECVCAVVNETGIIRQYCAPYAIVTISVGALRAGTITFSPELPQRKQTAINLSYDGLFLKIYLEFEDTFWPTDANYIIHADPQRGHFVHFLSLTQHITGNPNILLATVTGKWAKAVYNQNIDETKSQIMNILQTLYGRQIPDPISITIPEWKTNPLFMGMYSSYPPGYMHYWKDLLTNAGRVYFGGEATSLKYNGYVHGAYFSGIDVAIQVINSLTN